MKKFLLIGDSIRLGYQDQFIEIEASDEEEANDKAGLEAYLGDRDDTWGNTDVTHVDMTVVEVEEINV